MRALEAEVRRLEGALAATREDESTGGGLATARYQALMRVLPDLIFWTSEDGHILDYHALDPSKLLLPPEAFLGRLQREIFAPDLAERLDAASAETLRTGEPQKVPYELELQGEVLQFEAHLVPSGRGQVLTLVRDVSSLHRAEVGLELAKVIHDHLAESVWVVRLSDDTILEANQASEELYGYSRAEVIGKSAGDFFAGEENEREVLAARILAEVRETGRWEGELLRRHKSGREFWARVSATAFHHPEWGPVAISFTRDIDSRKAAEAAREKTLVELAEAKDRAEAANRAKSTFLATMSHEIRTPLNGVLGMAQLLETTPLDSKQESYVSILHSSGKALLHLLDQVLDLSKIEAGQVELQAQPFSPRRLVENVVELFRPRLKSVALEVDLASWPADRLAVGDPLRVRQILLNYLSNAVKVTDQGSIVVRLRLAPAVASGEMPHLLLAVHDTGPGLSLADQLELFQPFHQLVATRERGGTGLGLAICRRLAELMGGTVGCETALGEGATFWAEIPVSTIAAQTGSEAVAPARPFGSVRWPGRRVIVAEDDPASQVLSRAMLACLGVDAVVCANGRELTERWLEARWDAVLLDCQMPELDGWATAEWIRAREVGEARRTPIIGLTAYALVSDRARCLAAGMDDVVTKPVDFARLEAALASFWG